MKICYKSILPVFCYGWLMLLSELLPAQVPLLSGIINRYTVVVDLQTDGTCGQRIVVADTTGFRVGDVILIAQQQGADAAVINAAAYGSVTALNCAGCIERSQIVGVAGQTIYLAERLTLPYDPKNGRVQLVRVPRYPRAVVTDTIFAKPWDGTTGGIVALEVTDTLWMQAPIAVSGRGFRGGAAFQGPNNRCSRLTNNNDFSYPLGNWRGGRKGEGIANSAGGQELGRGAWATAGGGGNDHNAGGGGGANLTAGGDGGQNLNPDGLDCRGLFPGTGGRKVTAPTERLWMGGGGGGGHANGTATGQGGQGGGLIMLSVGVLTGSRPHLWAAGGKGDIGVSDGGGGGGAGGTIWLLAAAVPANLLAAAPGGEGGSTNNASGDQCTGPGGGGGGGRILTNVANIPTPAGGVAGSITKTKAACLGGTGNAKVGSVGLVQGLTPLQRGPDAGRPQITAMPTRQEVCPDRAATFSLTLRNAAAGTYQWEIWDEAAGQWRSLTASPPYRGTMTPDLTINPVAPGLHQSQYRCRVMAPGCYTVWSDPATLELISGPQSAFSCTIADTLLRCTNQSTGAVRYHWDFGDGNTSAEPAPDHVYANGGTYTVVLRAIGRCDTAVTRQEVTIVPRNRLSAAFGWRDTASCTTVAVRFTNQSTGSPDSLRWFFPGGQPATAADTTPLVRYLQSGSYTARLIVYRGTTADSTRQTVHVRVLTTPTATFVYENLGAEGIRFVNQSSNAVRYSWNFGDGSPNVAAVSPTYRYAQPGTYTVTLLADNPCGATVFQMTVVAGPVSTPDRPTLPALRIFPNPTEGLLSVEVSDNSSIPDTYILYDLWGRAQQVMSPTLPQIILDLRTLPAGLYTLAVFGADGRAFFPVVKM